MAHFFNYDNGFNKHRIFGIETKNEKGETVGYRPVVQRVNGKQGGLVEQISDKYPQVKWKIFSTEKLAREFAIQFFIVSGSLPPVENELWIEANKLYSKKEHSQDGRDLQMKHFTIQRRQRYAAKRGG